ncbi:hypothetical protein SAMN04488688_11297 [Paenibacillus sp. cl141a]|uniref:hypothetical protein n=1 Tax=Paenibacillus sp. cl141a TaxID=1761877 RepID=UPI0008C221F0|nr:hypothetical protein [Paenibacillus sp. cl141a]SEM38561.1 hypothetical protein SAMN04488688_11297 [Paenibacillus sp. cl141a]
MVPFHPTGLSSSAKRIRRMLDPSYPLCREDVMWVLHFVQKKVALKDPALQDLSKPRLLQNFNSYCEAALLLLGSGNHFHTKNGDIRTCLLEAMHGLPELAEAISPTKARTFESMPLIPEDDIHTAAREQN